MCVSVCVCLVPRVVIGACSEKRTRKRMPTGRKRKATWNPKRQKRPSRSHRRRRRRRPRSAPNEKPTTQPAAPPLRTWSLQSMLALHTQLMTRMWESVSVSVCLCMRVCRFCHAASGPRVPPPPLPRARVAAGPCAPRPPPFTSSAACNARNATRCSARPRSAPRCTTKCPRKSNAWQRPPSPKVISAPPPRRGFCTAGPPG